MIDYIRVPVLGIQGRDDQYGTLAQLAEIESRCYAPFEQCVLEECGHSPHVEQPEQTLDVITGFCERLKAAGALT